MSPGSPNPKFDVNQRTPIKRRPAEPHPQTRSQASRMESQRSAALKSPKRLTTGSKSNLQRTMSTSRMNKFRTGNAIFRSRSSFAATNAGKVLKRRQSLKVPSLSRSPLKTRALRRQEVDGEASDLTRCFHCHSTKPVQELRQCPNCESQFHLSCLCLQPETLQFVIEDAQRWSCPRCLTCAKCDEYIADPGNVQCIYCARAWHGECRPKKSSLPEYPYNRWCCEACKSKHRLTREETPKDRILSPSKCGNASNADISRVKSRKAVRKALQDQQSSTLRLNNMNTRERRTSTDEDNFSKRLTRACNKSQNSSIPSDQRIVKIVEPVNIPAVKRREQQLIGKMGKWMCVAEEKNNARDLAEAGSLPGRRANLLNTSPRSTKPTASAYRGTLGAGGGDQAGSAQGETDYLVMQKQLLEEMGYNSDNKSNRNSSNEWVQFGQFVRYKPPFESAYQEPVCSAPIIYICEFCLSPMAEHDQFRSHMMFCPRRTPPGNEICRDGLEGWDVWEVEGNIETAYCRNLCLLAKLFLSSKTLYHEVDTFTFYILTEITPRGCVIVGYFSKEKNPSKNNNLSCLLTLPSAQGKGYGKLLIDFSYQLSKLEHKIGSPEHPLSDMGLLAYRSYWRSVLFSALRQRKSQQVISIKDLSVETAIHSYDIVSTLLLNNMLLHLNDSYYIDINKALNVPLGSLRRRTIKTGQLLWQPSFEPNPHSRMCSYVTAD